MASKIKPKGNANARAWLIWLRLKRKEKKEERQILIGQKQKDTVQDPCPKRNADITYKKATPQQNGKRGQKHEVTKGYS